jgi:hypothetical protein
MADQPVAGGTGSGHDGVPVDPLERSDSFVTDVDHVGERIL